jgi:hypothetical protein
MIIHDLNVLGASACPTEADTKFVVDPNAILARSIAFERFQSISRRYAQIIQSARDFQLAQFSASYSGNVGEPSDSFPF